MNKKIKEMQPHDRPREKLLEKGARTLSDAELLAVLLGKGSARLDVLSLAGKVVPEIDKKGFRLSVKDLIGFDGIGPARAALVAASLEFARRRLRPARRKISEPADVMPLVTHWADRPQEHFLVLSLNGAHEVLRLRVISQGILDRTIVHPREVFVDPLSDRAAAIVCAHNHPSGNTDPSPEDRELTRRLKDSGELLGIPLLDHVIFTQNGYYSFLEKGMI